MQHNLRRSITLPAVRVALCLIAGILAGDQLAPPSWLPLMPACILALSALVLHLLPHPAPVARLVLALCLYALVLSSGMVLAARAIEAVDTALLPYADTRERVLVRGIIDEHPAIKRNRVSFVLRTDSLLTGGRLLAVPSRVLVYYAPSMYEAGDTLAHIARGDTIVAEGALRSARPLRNPGGFDFRAWLGRQGLTTTLAVNAGARLKVIGPSTSADLSAAVAEARAWVRTRIRALYPLTRVDLMDALVLGEQGRVDEDLMQVFRDAGIIHVIAVSGGHLAILLVLIWVPLGRLPYPLRAAIALGVLFFYALLAGMAPPVSRSVVMAAVFLVGAGLQRTTDAVNTLAVAAIAILIPAPGALFNAGFQLSFAAVLALVWLYPRIIAAMRRRMPRLWQWAWFRVPVETLAMTAAAQAGTFPILASLFGTFSLVSFAANLVAVPLIFVAMATGFPALVFSAMGSFPARELAAVSDLCMELIVASSRCFAALPGAVLTLPPMSPWLLAGWIALLLYLFATPGRLRWKAAVASSVVAAAVVWAPFFAETDAIPVPADGGMRVTFLDVGQGDATLVEGANGGVMLVDAGEATASFDAGERTVLPFLRARGIAHIDALVLTHPDNDHIGGVAALLERVSVGRVYRSGRWSRDDADAARIDSALHAHRVPVSSVHAGMRIPFDPAMRINVLAPDPALGTAVASNTSSIMLRIVHGSCSLLLPGDADEESERLVVARYGGLLAADVLKIAHHGSRTSTAEEFLARVHPAIAVISSGRLNKFRHPHPLLLDRLRAAGARVLRTDISGAIELRSDGRTLHAASFNAW